MRKIKKIICYVSAAMLCLSECFFSFQTCSPYNSVYASNVLLPSITCKIRNPDFVISDDETISVNDLKRHGIKVFKSSGSSDDGPDKTSSGQTTHSSPILLSDCEVIFPDQLKEGKNQILIRNYTDFCKFETPECSLEINITFSEDSEKKGLPERSDLIYGDTDSNKTVELTDLTRLSQALLGDLELTAEQFISADTNGDEEVNIVDLSTLRQYIMKDEIKLGHIKKSFEDIILVKIHRNWASQYQCKGVIYDKEGNEYPFDFSDKYQCMSNYILINEFKKLYSSSSCSSNHKLSKDDMSYIEHLVYKIDKDAPFVVENAACDAGNTQLFGVRHNGDFSDELILIHSGGDSIEIPTDKDALELYEYYINATSDKEAE